jgi:ubiquinone/menaquinone biosynthesis C-methylase UbiE
MAQEDTNEAVWKSAETVKRWANEAAAREGKRTERMAFMAALLPFKADEAFTFLDLGAGTGMAARGIMDHYPKANAVLADFSDAMMGEGVKALAPYEGRYKYVSFDMRSSDWPAGIPAQLDAAVTSLCVHHLPDERKVTLFKELFDHLKPGAWYVNYDPIKADDPVLEATWQRVNDRFDPDAAHARAHRNHAQQEQWENHVRYMIDLEPQMKMFRAAGFEAVDVYWKQLDYVIYGGRKPA